MLRRQLLQSSLAFGGGFVLANALDRLSYAQTSNLLDAASHPKFKTPLPIPQVIDATQGGQFNIDIRETDQFLGLYAPNGSKLTTTVWGYSPQGQAGVTYPGPTFVAKRDVAISVQWDNKLPKGKKGGHLLPIDLSTHLAQPIKKTIEQGYVPVVTHLHGGHSESASDGLPEAWFVQNFVETGADWVKKTYTYNNNQESGTLWYHDHALGITRLNVYAGLAGFYLLRDNNELQLISNGVLPGGSYEIGLAVQDRMFTTDGQLFYPTNPPTQDYLTCQTKTKPSVPNPSVLPEFFGNFILVNGVAWPILEVEPRKYRFRVLNGSDSRFYILQFSNNMNFYQIGTDQGFLSQAVTLNQLLLSPGERADLIVDFAGLDKQEIILKNLGPDGPFQGLGTFSPANSNTTGQVMKFQVSKTKSNVADAPNFNTTVTLRQGGQFKVDGVVKKTRQLVLLEGRDPYGRIQPKLGTLENGSLLWDDPITENPGLNDVETWEVYNGTTDAHPVHLHLVSFEVLNRQNFSSSGVSCSGQDMEGGTKQILNTPVLSGNPTLPASNELGPKDTVVMLPGQVTRIKAKFDRQGEYVWHCHILSHEDHEMMRPYKIG